jgi:hypothetical protein
MCVLCWQFVTEEHWTDRRVDEGDSATMGSAGSDRERARRRARHHRTRVLNHILNFYGLQLDDWQSRSYVLSDRKGKTVLVSDLGALWPAVQQLLGQCPDPLDPWLLERLHPPRSTSEFPP